ncbi:hypothetical protein GCM10023323_04240 [Streptomyces thinghirensis]|uniref:Uncharacterized protein n=1 Tax=Streptomyces thinghirensis TaxID=551547 RepID=A0ABP9SXH7_9ACTN
MLPAAALSLEQAERVPRPSAAAAVTAMPDMWRRRTFMAFIFNKYGNRCQQCPVTTGREGGEPPDLVGGQSTPVT